jgi:hypothetical protein
MLHVLQAFEIAHCIKNTSEKHAALLTFFSFMKTFRF